jgi:hypothetical protein
MKAPNLVTRVNGRYGAPMGRDSYTLSSGGEPLPEHAAGLESLRMRPRQFWLQCAPLNSGGYDAGGAYWGHSCDGRVYLAQSHDGRVARSYRSHTRRGAYLLLCDEFPFATVAGIAADITQRDRRYTVHREYDGSDGPRYVARFCDKFLASHMRRHDAVRAAVLHNYLRRNP